MPSVQPTAPTPPFFPLEQPDNHDLGPPKPSGQIDLGRSPALQPGDRATSLNLDYAIVSTAILHWAQSSPLRVQPPLMIQGPLSQARGKSTHLRASCRTAQLALHPPSTSTAHIHLIDLVGKDADRCATTSRSPNSARVLFPGHYSHPVALLLRRVRWPGRPATSMFVSARAGGRRQADPASTRNRVIPAAFPCFGCFKRVDGEHVARPTNRALYPRHAADQSGHMDRW